MSNAPFLEVYKLSQTTIQNHTTCIEIQFLEEVRATLWNYRTGKVYENEGGMSHYTPL
jgi:hypothetical protein